VNILSVLLYKQGAGPAEHQVLDEIHIKKQGREVNKK